MDRFVIEVTVTKHVAEITVRKDKDWWTASCQRMRQYGLRSFLQDSKGISGNRLPGTLDVSFFTTREGVAAQIPYLSEQSGIEQCLLEVMFNTVAYQQELSNVPEDPQVTQR